MLHRLELLAALVILASCALPFSTCTTYRDAEGKAVEVERGAPVPPGLTVEVDPQRPVDHFDLADLEMYPFMIAFVWPLAFTGIFARWPRTRSVRTLRLVQLLLLVFTAVVFYWQSEIGDRAWGAYVGFAALALYCAVWALDLRDHWPRRLRAAPA